MVQEIRAHTHPRTPVSGTALTTSPTTTSTQFQIEASPKGGHVWRIGGRSIPVGEIRSIIPAQAGVDFPTDGPAGLERDFTVFVTDAERIPSERESTGRDRLRRRYAIQDARAGFDYPTDTPPRRFSVLVDLNRDSVPDTQFRVRISDIARIERAQAGIDYPTDGPANMRRNFFVAVLLPNFEGNVRRIRL